MVNDIEKLRILIPHWLEHNEEHAEEYRRWAEKAGAASADVLSAVEALKAVNQALALALGKLGGAAPHSHSH